MAQRKRTVRRAEDRAQSKLTRDLEKLWSLEPGATPSRPLVIASPSEVEVRATSIPCPVCRSALRLDEHAAEIIDGVRLRVARVTCSFCRARRSVYFRLAGTMVN